MYAIANEKGVNENGEMVYEIFGVKLKTLKDIREVLKSLELIEYLENEKSLLNKILTHSERNTVIRYIKSGSKVITDPDKLPFWPENIETDDRIFQYKTFSNVLENGNIHKLLIDLFYKYFDTPQKQFDRIHVKLELYKLLEICTLLDFDIVKNTSPYITYGKPYSDISSGVGNLTVARKNALALMTLTGKTSYIDNGTLVPLIINGVERVKKNWEEVSSEGKMKTLVAKK